MSNPLNSISTNHSQHIPAETVIDEGVKKNKTAETPVTTQSEQVSDFHNATVLSATEGGVETVATPVLRNAVPIAASSVIQNTVINYQDEVHSKKPSNAYKLAQWINDKLIPSKNGSLMKFVKWAKLYRDIRETGGQEISAKERSKGGVVSSFKRSQKPDAAKNEILRNHPQATENQKTQLNGLCENENYTDMHPKEGHHLSFQSLSQTADVLNSNKNVKVFCSGGALDIKAACLKDEGERIRDQNRRSIETAVKGFIKADKPILNIQLNVDKAHWIQIQYNKATNKLYVIDPQGQVDNRPGYSKALHETLRDVRDAITSLSEPQSTSPTIVNENKSNPSLNEKPLQKEGYTCGAQCMRNILLASSFADNHEGEDNATVALQKFLKGQSESPSLMYPENQTTLNPQTLNPKDVRTAGVLDVFKMITSITENAFDKQVDDIFKSPLVSFIDGFSAGEKQVKDLEGIVRKRILPLISPKDYEDRDDFEKPDQSDLAALAQLRTKHPDKYQELISDNYFSQTDLTPGLGEKPLRETLNAKIDEFMQLKDSETTKPVSSEPAKAIKDSAKKPDIEYLGSTGGKALERDGSKILDILKSNSSRVKASKIEEKDLYILKNYLTKGGDHVLADYTTEERNKMLENLKPFASHLKDSIIELINRHNKI